MKTTRPGSSGSSSPSGASEPGGTPGKTTLVQQAEVQQAGVVQRKAADGSAAPTGEAGATPAADGAPLENFTSGGPVFEGGEFFAPPDGDVSASIPAPAKDMPAPAKTDEEYESTVGVKDAIDKGKMVAVAGVNGQSFVATGVAGKADGKITFKFVKAYVGDYDYAAAGGKTVRGAHVVISATLENCGAHSDVKFVQVFRNIVKNGGKMDTAEPDTAKRKERAGWSDAGAKSRGWGVDELDTGTSPFYVTSDLYGQHGSDAKAARLRDSPGFWSDKRNLGREFRTCAVSYAGGKGTVLACIDWGYYIDGAGNVSFYPVKPTAYSGAVSEVLDASKRWDGDAANTKANIDK
jgi:hypothetical protein